MSDDQDPRYDEATEPEQPVDSWADQPPLFEEPAATPHDIELVAEPEGSWEPEDEPAWEPELEPDLPEAWDTPAEETGDEPAPDAEPQPPAALEEAPDELPVALTALDEPPDPAVDDQDLLLLAPVEETYAHQDADAYAPADDDGYTDGYTESGDAEAAPAAGRNGRGLVPALSVLVVALLLLTGFLGYTVADNRGAEPIVSTRASALAAGRDAARLVFSYDYRHLDKDFAAAAAATTGKFKTDYESTTKKLVGDVAPRYKAVLLAEVSEAGVITASANEVQLLVFLDVQSTSTLAATPKVTPRRLKMTMHRTGDRWLVSAVDAF